MTAALRALLAGAIDYAGLFPPASLPLAEAIKLNRDYRRTPEGWMLGRFVCPAGNLAELGKIYNRESDGLVTVITMPSPDDCDFFHRSVDETLARMSAYPDLSAIDTIESRWPPQVCADIFMIDVTIAAAKLKRGLPAAATMFFEYVLDDRTLADEGWGSHLVLSVGALRDRIDVFHSLAIEAGLKFRTGGTTAAAVPPSWQLASVITACRDAGLFWKATAGLHHPFRQHDPGLATRTHGFLNVLVAAVLADVHGLSTGQVQGILGDEDPEHFRFTGDTLTLREWSVTAEQIAASRQRGLRSFGSCSFEEPVQDLKRLGLL